MAKGAYVGVNGVARNVKNIYVGIDGKARKVKKAYVGVPTEVEELVYGYTLEESTRAFNLDHKDMYGYKALIIAGDSIDLEDYDYYVIKNAKAFSYSNEEETPIKGKYIAYDTYGYYSEGQSGDLFVSRWEGDPHYIPESAEISNRQVTGALVVDEINDGSEEWSWATQTSTKSVARVAYDPDEQEFVNKEIPDLENADWLTISAVARSGKAREYWNIGDTKTIKIDGDTYHVQIIGFDYDNVTYPHPYGRQKAGITFQLVECYKTKYSMSVSSDSLYTAWQDSSIRKTTLPNIKALMDKEAASVVVLVDKTSDLFINEMHDGSHTTADELFLLGSYECYFEDGNIYEYFANGGSRIKTVSGVASDWFLRDWSEIDTPDREYSGFARIAKDGRWTSSASGSYGVSFAFCV